MPRAPKAAPILIITRDAVIGTDYCDHGLVRFAKCLCVTGQYTAGVTTVYAPTGNVG